MLFRYSAGEAGQVRAAKTRKQDEEKSTIRVCMRCYRGVGINRLYLALYLGNLSISMHAAFMTVSSRPPEAVGVGKAQETHTVVVVMSSVLIQGDFLFLTWAG